MNNKAGKLLVTSLIKKPTKLICGVKHWQVTCNRCHLPVWTQSNVDQYVCDTCLNAKFKGGCLGLTPVHKPLLSERRYNG